jgi:hypothetical protein
MFDLYLRSDHREKSRRVFKRNVDLRHAPKTDTHRRGMAIASSFIDGFLTSRVGRPWDEVFAEICSRFDRRSMMGETVRKHFAGRYCWGIELNCYIGRDGNVRDVLNHCIVYGFYVHPETGILCHNPSPHTKAARRRFYWNSPSDIIGVKDGEWFFVHVGYHGTRRPADYYFELREVGKSPKNRTKAWFYIAYYTKIDRYFSPCHDQSREVAYYRIQGYEQKETSISTAAGKHPVNLWGHWHEYRQTVETKRSCNREQLAQIHAFITKKAAEKAIKPGVFSVY